jgi:hypothetical protein
MINMFQRSIIPILLVGCATDLPNTPQQHPSGEASPILSHLSSTSTAWNTVDEGVADVAKASLRVVLEERNGWGPFFIQTSPLAPIDGDVSPYPPVEQFPSSEWACETDQVFTRDGEVLILRAGCRVDHLDRLVDADAYAGDFDAAAYFVDREDGGLDLQMWVDNRLEVGIDRFRYVMRIAPEALPANTEDLRVLFGFDDYLLDPLNNLRDWNRSLTNSVAWMYQVASVEGDTDRYFVRNRNKVSSMMSVHTPDWGFMLHGTDPDNADPGWLLVGANPSDDGTISLEFGYEYKLQGEYQAGNGVSGPMQMGPTLRGQHLAAERPLDAAWWEALDAYIPYLEDETDLLPDVDLANSAYPAEWAQDCLFAVWNVGPPGGANTVTEDDLAKFKDEFEAVMDTYASADGEPLVFCPLLWDFHTYSPRTIRPAAAGLLKELQAMAVERNVELHAGAYYLPYMADPDRLVGHPMQDAVIYTVAGVPLSGGDGLVFLDQAHPAVIADMLNTLETEYDLGVDWAYHDNPFREMMGWESWAASSRDFHVNTRDMIQRMAEHLTELGGGLVAIEAGRLGLSTMQAGASGVTGGMFPGSESSHFSDALFHGRHLTAFAGDVGGEPLNLVFGDERSTPYLCPSGPCPYTGAMKNNVDHMPRLAMTAALGRSVIDPAPSLREQMTNPLNPAWVQEAHGDYQTAVYNAYWLRRNTPALRTGRMMPTPPSDAPKVIFASRSQTSMAVFDRAHQAIERRAPKFSAGLFEDVETPGQYVLVVGNPEKGLASQVVTFTLDARDYPDLIHATVRGAIGTLSEDEQTLTLEVTVPALDFTVVTFDSLPLEGDVPVDEWHIVSVAGEVSW